MRATSIVLGALAVSFLARPTPAEAAKIVVAGDSWAEQSAGELENVLASHGQAFITVAGYGIGGTTADLWANLAPNALSDLVSLNPDAEWVWLSIGGNDLFGNYAFGMGAQNAAIYEGNLRKILTTLWLNHPDIKVVMFAYDFVNFEQSPQCITQGLTYFGAVNTAQINQYMVDDVHGTQQALDPEFPRLLHVHQVLGTLQANGGIPGAPNILFPSPSQYMNDCIHPTSQGYTLIHEVLWANYWALPAPTAAITTDDTAVCVGDTAIFNYEGFGEAWWSVNGELQTSGPSFELPAENPGAHTVALEVFNGAWSDSDSVQVSAESLPVVELLLPGTVMVGETIEAEASSDLPASFLWEAEGNGLVAANGELATLRWDNPGTYTVTVSATSPAGCPGQAEAQIQVEPDPSGGDTSDTGGESGGAGSGDSSGGEDTGSEGLGGLEAGGDGGCACSSLDSRGRDRGGPAGAALLTLFALAGLRRRSPYSGNSP